MIHFISISLFSKILNSLDLFIQSIILPFACQHSLFYLGLSLELVFMLPLFIYASMEQDKKLLPQQYFFLFFQYLADKQTFLMIINEVSIFNKNYKYFLNIMASNQDKVNSILDKMQQNNDPVALSEGLNILCQFAANIISNPFEQKYRGINTSNNTIKNKIMSLKQINELLTTLGFVRYNEEMYILRDQQIGSFLAVEPSLDYCRGLAATKLTNQAYQKNIFFNGEKKQENNNSCTFHELMQIQYSQKQKIKKQFLNKIQDKLKNLQLFFLKMRSNTAKQENSYLQTLYTLFLCQVMGQYDHKDEQIINIMKQILEDNKIFLKFLTQVYNIQKELNERDIFINIITLINYVPKRAFALAYGNQKKIIQAIKKKIYQKE